MTFGKHLRVGTCSLWSKLHDWRIGTFSPTPRTLARRVGLELKSSVAKIQSVMPMYFMNTQKDGVLRTSWLVNMWRFGETVTLGESMEGPCPFPVPWPLHLFSLVVPELNAFIINLLSSEETSFLSSVSHSSSKFIKLEESWEIGNFWYIARWSEGQVTSWARNWCLKLGVGGGGSLVGLNLYSVDSDAIVYVDGVRTELSCGIPNWYPESYLLDIWKTPSHTRLDWI